VMEGHAAPLSVLSHLLVLLAELLAVIVISLRFALDRVLFAQLMCSVLTPSCAVLTPPFVMLLRDAQALQ
jgi:hypothetical protein